MSATRRGPDKHSERPGRWVLLSYRVPREPSTPRIAIWRKLDRFGVARLGDGLVALPFDARTREHLDWLAQDVVEAGGTATVWLAEPASRAQEHAIARQMAADRASEYRRVIDAAEGAHAESDTVRARTLRRLWADMRRIARRDYFPPPEREQSRRAVESLADPGSAHRNRSEGREEQRL